MAVQAVPTKEVQESEKLRTEVERLSAELAVTALRVDAALAITPLLDCFVEDARARGVVVDDIVNCWLRLEPAVREAYGPTDYRAPIGRFGADYVQAVEDMYGVDVPPDMHDTDTGRLDLLEWRIQVAQIERRKILGQPPSTQWLAQFPLPIGP